MTSSSQSVATDIGLLGRVREIEALDELLAPTLRAGRVVLVDGEPGLGKTSLLDAAAALAAERGWGVARAAGAPLEHDFPFGVVLQLFEARLAALDASEREALFSGAAGLAAPLFPGLADGPGDAAGAGPHGLLHGLHWLTAGLSAERPLLLVVDDVQWADERSQAFLGYLAHRIGELAVVVLLAGTAAPAGLRPGPATLRLRLGRLGPEAAATLVRREFPGADDSFCAACHGATGGVPGLLRALLAAARSEDVPASAEGVPLLPALAPVAIADGVRAHLDEDAAGLAEAAAVLGDGARLRHAAALAGLDLHAAASVLDALDAAAVLVSGDTIRFRHPIVCDALHAGLPRGRRGLLHLSAARLLEADGAPVEAVAGHLVHVQAGAGDPWLVRRLRAAAARALERGAPATAVRLLERALDEPPPPRDEVELRIELGLAETAAGGGELRGAAPVGALDGGARGAGRVLDALGRVRDPRRRVSALLRLGEIQLERGEREPAVRSFAEGLAVGRAADPEKAMELEAGLLAAARPVPALRPYATEALCRAGETDGGTGAGRAVLAERALEAAVAGRPADEVLGLAERALRRGALVRDRQAGGPRARRAFAAAVRALAAAGDLQSAELALGRLVAEAGGDGAVPGAAEVCTLRAEVALRRGSIEEALAEARSAAGAACPDGAPQAHIALAAALVEAGRPEEGIAQLPGIREAGASPAGDAARRAAANDLSAGDDAAAAVVRGRALLALHDAAGALAELRRAGAILTALGHRGPGVLAWRSDAALAARAAGEDEIAEHLAADELAAARAAAAPPAMAAALRAVASVRGGEAGIALLAEAIELLGGSPARLERAKALAALGAALRRDRRRGAAREPLREARELARRCGAEGLEQEVLAELRAAGARPRRRAASGFEALTASELRVVDRATDGLSNREIAQALFVSVKTVEWHLRSSYRKLGIASKPELLRAVAASRTAP